jgi:hypothetical protein
MRLLLKKSENCITKIILRARFWPLAILDSLTACSKSRCPPLDSPKAQCILVITLFKFGDDLCVRFLVKMNRLDDHVLLPVQQELSWTRHHPTLFTGLIPVGVHTGSPLGDTADARF